MKIKNIIIYGINEYALAEALVLTRHHQIYLVLKNADEKNKLKEQIKKSAELSQHQSEFNQLKIVHLVELNTKLIKVIDAILFFAGSSSDFNQLCQLQSTFKKPPHLIDCSSENWQLIDLKKSEENLKKNKRKPHPYFVVAQYPQQGKLISQLSKRNFLIVGIDRAHLVNKNKVSETIKTIKQIYSLSSQTHIKLTDYASAYLSKYVLNVQLATRIALMNEASNLAEILGADIEEIRKCVSLDTRIGSQYLKAGTGFGGTSFMKDLTSLTELLNQQTSQSSLFQDVVSANSDQQEILFRKLWHYYSMNLNNKKIAIWGLSFKPETTDISLSPAIKVIKILLAQGVKISAFDPLVKEVHLKNKLSHNQITQLNLKTCPIEACQDSDAVLIFNELNLFKQIDLEALKKVMKRPVIFDGRNLFDLNQIKKSGFEYFSVGRA